ncbi:SRPBCC family protein [Sporichthya sp.]|uniref:SRPBCC family protein n=1 Tax=Sporichthya sp. TaxID=65475 RepID=UPI001844B890|nr:SRPBCC family protein [Sporichthya sp.]MBA3743535.1 SRPBCC family protein [Sporichthya sp.]
MGATTRVTRFIAASPDAVYRVLIDPTAVQQWMVPNGMTSEVHSFDAREGGEFAISLTYDDPVAVGKTEGATDTFAGRFAELVPGESVVQVAAFDTTDPALAGEMTIRYLLTERDGGTEVLGIHENLPPGVAPEDNEWGWRISLGKLAQLVESRGA